MAASTNIQYLRVVSNADVNFKRTNTGEFMRITSIDRRQPGHDYPVCELTEHGVYVEKTGYLAKLLPLSSIADIDVIGNPKQVVAPISSTAK